jgi:hypothetical protein
MPPFHPMKPAQLQRHYLARFCYHLLNDYAKAREAGDVVELRNINDTVIRVRALEVKMNLTGKIVEGKIYASLHV